MATKGLNKAVANLKFLDAAKNSIGGLAGYLQGFFGQTAGVIRKVGTVTVAQGATTATLVDASIAATDIVAVDLITAGANACVVTSVVINAATNFVVTVNTDPGAGGCVFTYHIIRPVSHQ